MQSSIEHTARPSPSACLALSALGLLLLITACGAPKLYEGTPVGQVPETSSSRQEDLQSAAEDEAERDDDEDRDSAPDSDLEGASDPAQDDSDAPSDAPSDQDRSTPGVDAAADDPPPPTRRAPTAPGPTSPAASPTAGASAPTETGSPSAEDMVGRIVRGGSLGSIYRLVDLRSGRHEGFTRFVWELGSEAGSGPYFEAVEERGDSGSLRIRLRVSDLYAYDYTGAMSLDAPPDAIATGLRPLTTADDAIMAFAIDLQRPARYAITTLQDPLRIVLDVYDD